LRATLLWWVQKLLLALCVVQGIALGVWKFGLFVLCMVASCNDAAKGFGLVSVWQMGVGH
jgi:hypothetical protein